MDPKVKPALLLSLPFSGAAGGDVQLIAAVEDSLKCASSLDPLS